MPLALEPYLAGGRASLPLWALLCLQGLELWRGQPTCPACEVVPFKATGGCSELAVRNEELETALVEQTLVAGQAREEAPRTTWDSVAPGVIASFSSAAGTVVVLAIRCCCGAVRECCARDGGAARREEVQVHAGEWRRRRREGMVV